jgi:hypothetical protein
MSPPHGEAVLRFAPQARFWGKSETITSPKPSIDRMAKIRLPLKQARKIRRKHGCNAPQI